MPGDGDRTCRLQRIFLLNVCSDPFAVIADPASGLGLAEYMDQGWIWTIYNIRLHILQGRKDN